MNEKNAENNSAVLNRMKEWFAGPFHIIMWEYLLVCVIIGVICLGFILGSILSGYTVIAWIAAGLFLTVLYAILGIIPSKVKAGFFLLLLSLLFISGFAGGIFNISREFFGQMFIWSLILLGALIGWVPLSNLREKVHFISTREKNDGEKHVQGTFKNTLHLLAIITLYTILLEFAIILTGLV